MHEKQTAKSEKCCPNESSFTLDVPGTIGRCAVGERVAEQNSAEGKTPVLSCEGACIRGEIARIAANLVAQEAPYRRACHGELLAVPQSAMHRWVREAGEVVLIDGCFLRCQGRLMDGLVEKSRLRAFDAVSHHKKYSDIFDMDAVPADERRAVARDVADWVLSELRQQSTEEPETGGGEAVSGCCG